MKIQAFILTMSGMAVLLTGCQNPDGTQNNTGSGALMGGAFGALTGAAIGGRHHGGEDAFFGAAAGALAGGLIGNSLDRQQETRLRAQAPQTYVKVDQGQPLSIADVKSLARAGISEDIIISQIKSSRTVYHLSSADIIDLRDAGVTDRVVNYMISTPSLVNNPAVAAPMVVQQAPPPPPVETVVVAPDPGYVWVGGEWVWNGGWFWVAGHWGRPPHPHAVWVGGRDWQDGRGWHHDRGHWR